jgi:hypothetical protein
MARPSGLLDEAEPDEAQRGQRQDDRGGDDVHRGLQFRYRLVDPRVLAGR